MRSSAPAEVSAEFCGSGAPLTTKLVPANASNAALSDGSLRKSWTAQLFALLVFHRHDASNRSPWITQN